MKTFPEIWLKLSDEKSGKSPMSPEARTIANDVDGLRAKVRGLLEGLEPEVALAVDVLIPSRRVAATSRATCTMPAACPPCCAACWMAARCMETC